MIAPTTIEALSDVARALGFDLVELKCLVTAIGIDADSTMSLRWFRLVSRGGDPAFDGTARECAAFLIGWRDLRARVLGNLHAVDAKSTTELMGRAPCGAVDQQGRSCIARVGHDGLHCTMLRWEALALS